MWLGHSIHSHCEFRVPDDCPPRASKFRVDASGTKFIHVNGVRWFTNLEHSRRAEKMTLTKIYAGHESDYPYYDSYGAIEVSRTKYIPSDFDGVMGVPISFLDKYNPKQFEILGIDRYIEDNPYPGKRLGLYGNEVYARILIRNRKPRRVSKGKSLIA